MKTRTLIAAAMVTALIAPQLARADDGWTDLDPGETLETQKGDGTWQSWDGAKRYKQTADGEIKYQTEHQGTQEKKTNEAKLPKNKKVRKTRAGHSIELSDGMGTTPTDDMTNQEFRRLLDISPLIAGADGMMLYPVHSGADGMLAEQMEMPVMGILGVTRAMDDSILLLGSTTSDGFSPMVFQIPDGSDYTLIAGDDIFLAWRIGTGSPLTIGANLLLNDYGDTSASWTAVAPTPGSTALLGLGSLLMVRRRSRIATPR